jgi:hypothetical protein
VWPASTLLRAGAAAMGCAELALAANWAVANATMTAARPVVPIVIYAVSPGDWRI